MLILIWIIHKLCYLCFFATLFSLILYDKKEDYFIPCFSSDNIGRDNDHVTFYINNAMQK